MAKRDQSEGEPVVVAPGKYGFSVEDAANAWAEHLSETAQRFLDQMERYEGIPKHVHLLGYVLYMEENGLLSYRPGEHAMPPGVPMAGAPTAKPTEPASCKWCGSPFQPTRPGQLYCPDPPEDDPLEVLPCGMMAAKAAIRKSREGKGDFRDTRAKPEHLARRKALVVTQGLVPIPAPAAGEEVL